MTGELVETPRDDWWRRKNLIAFERRERQLRKQERKERAQQLRLPVLEQELQS